MNPPQSTNISSALAANGRLIQLDGLRWFAVLGVMMTHFLSLEPTFGKFGQWGVHFFFVLSGYLIGRILFTARERILSNTTTIKEELANFYIRRSLRIFPAFYALILVTYLLGNWADAPFAWMALYMLNVWEVLNCETAGIFGHIYTLCIEEQFYLFFPLVVFAISRHVTLGTLCLMLLSGLAYRTIAIEGLELCNASRLVFAQLDAFAAGSLLGWIYQTGLLSSRSNHDMFRRWGLIATLLYFFNFYFSSPNGWFTLPHTLDHFLFTVFACWLIHGATRGFTGILGAILQFGPFVYFGQISYGIYLYHNFAGWFVINSLSRLGFDDEVSGPIIFTLMVVWSILVASLSWHLMELPINKAKRFFDYKSKKIDPEIAAVQ